MTAHWPALGLANVGRVCTAPGRMLCFGEHLSDCGPFGCHVGAANLSYVLNGCIFAQRGLESRAAGILKGMRNTRAHSFVNSTHSLSGKASSAGPGEYCLGNAVATLFRPGNIMILLLVMLSCAASVLEHFVSAIGIRRVSLFGYNLKGTP